MTDGLGCCPWMMTPACECRRQIRAFSLELWGIDSFLFSHSHSSSKKGGGTHKKISSGSAEVDMASREEQWQCPHRFVEPHWHIGSPIITANSKLRL
jgi:hypothetical protein